jgi:hypothetical protein
MRAAAASAIFGLLAAGVCEAKQAHCQFRVHTEASKNDGTVFTTQYRSPFSGKALVLGRMPAISERDVVGFQVYPAGPGTYGVLFQLNDHGRLALDSLSLERRGAFLFVFINGRPITELQIDRRVSDGKIYIASGLTTNDIALMKKDWREGGPRKK